MRKTYKVISENEFGEMYIEHSDSLETAMKIYNKSIEEGYVRCYLLEEDTKLSITGDSLNKIMSTYFR